MAMYLLHNEVITVTRSCLTDLDTLKELEAQIIEQNRYERKGRSIRCACFDLNHKITRTRRYMYYYSFY